MPRWLALSVHGALVGPSFEAGDRTAAYDRGCALFGPACETVQSAVSWELDQALRRTLERQRGQTP